MSVEKLKIFLSSSKVKRKRNGLQKYRSSCSGIEERQLNKLKYSSVAQWRSNRLLTGRLLVRVQPGEFFIVKIKARLVLAFVLTKIYNVGWEPQGVSLVLGSSANELRLDVDYQRDWEKYPRKFERILKLFTFWGKNFKSDW